jgi:hypothetical protein
VVIPFLRTRSGLNEFAGMKIGNRQAVDKLGGPEKAVPGLIIYYRMPKLVAPWKADAVRLLGHCSTSDPHGAASQVLLAALHDENDQVKGCAAAFLAMHDDRAIREEFIQVLLKMGQSTDYRTYSSAAFAFGRIRPVDQRAVGMLANVVRIAAADGLGSSAPGGYSFDQACALKALGEMGGEAAVAIPTIEAEMKNSSPAIRAAAAEALEKIRGGEAKQ